MKDRCRRKLSRIGTWKVVELRKSEKKGDRKRDRDGLVWWGQTTSELGQPTSSHYFQSTNGRSFCNGYNGEEAGRGCSCASQDMRDLTRQGLIHVIAMNTVRFSSNLYLYYSVRHYYSAVYQFIYIIPKAAQTLFNVISFS